jgi:hypothetical protein
MEKGKALIVLGWLLLLVPWTFVAVPAVVTLAAGTCLVMNSPDGDDDDDQGEEVMPFVFSGARA